ncbi:MAG: hypothetical protein LAP40_23130 [Acidobacteriia bacterium]|nr:hypothetical protein [Terriglobia bacterium]
MQSVEQLKEQAVTDTPVLVFDCVLPNGQTEHWCTHALTVGTTSYQARVLEHSAFDIQTASDQGVDGSPRISIVLANADSHFSEIERAYGWKGARLTVSFLFYDLRNQTALTETAVLFQGICNPPDEIREATFRLTAVNRMNLQRLVLPPVRVQRRCPWQFPTNLAQRTEAVDGGVDGRYSRYYRCGYSPDVPGGCGSLNAGTPFASCGFTRTDCQTRGMLQRFGGIEYIPPAIPVRAYGKDWSTSAVAVNQARYNDFVPMVYGTAWYTPQVVFARNDGNLTHMEVLLGIGPMTEVLTVLVNDVQIPLGVSGTNMTGTGWYNVGTMGSRDGSFDPGFLDASGHPAGDPYGSMAYLVVVVPTRLSSGSSLPTVKVLAHGLQVPVYAASGAYTSDQFSSNPAWILLDVLRRSGWAASEIDIPSFAAAAAYCDEPINATDLNGNPTTLPRFQCNLVLQARRSGGDVVRGIRNAARLYLTYGPGGVLQLQVENTAALENPTKPANSNSAEPLNGGWASYEFGDGSSEFSGLLRRPNGEPNVVLSSRSIAETPNRFTVEFQDALNGYQQDSYTMLDPDDVADAGQEISTALAALGIPNYDQAARILKFNLDKAVRGNTYIQFDTSVKAVGIRPGDIITVTYLKEGFQRQPFRVNKISPSTNYRTSTITAQIHDDAWYADTNGQVSSTTGTTYPRSMGLGIPKPLLGNTLDSNGNVQFGVTESASLATDGAAETNVVVSFVAPASVTAAGPGAPLINLAAAIGGGGTLAAGETLYYAVSGEDETGNESVLSFIVRASVANDASAVTVSELSFAPGTSKFHVYRGTTPAQLLRIASDQPLASEFTDTGLPIQLISPADANFDHANFYWRLELQPEAAVTVHSPATAGNGTLQMGVNGYRGMTARITRGKGQGQERTILSNDATTLTISPPWTVEPDASSYFVIAEAGWRFGALTRSSPVQLAIPNHAGEVVEITGRSANVNDAECAPELSTVTRWQIGGAGMTDSAVPPLPSFGLGAGPRGGTVELSGVSFTDLTNTRTISSATLKLHYWDELLGTPPITLATAVDAEDSRLTLSTPGPARPGSILQIEGEVMRVESVTNDTHYQVARGSHGSQAAAHGTQAPVYHLLDQAVIAPFPPDFFGSPYSGTWSYSVSLSSVRVASAELFVTNARGNSPTASISLTGTRDVGLRTHSGGQIDLTVDGVVAIESNAVPPATLPYASSVRDIFATVGQAPIGSSLTCVVKVSGNAIATLTIPDGQIVSNTMDMTTHPSVEGLVIPAGQPVTLDLTAVGSAYPGKRLTATVRL